MIRRYKKLFLSFVALLSVFALASCSQEQSGSKNAAKTETAKVETIDGEWELVDTLDALTESIGAYTLHGIHFAHLLESVKDFKMDMKIENNTATIKYDYNIDNFIKAFSTVTTEARGKTEEEFKKIMYDSHEGFAGDFKKYKVSMNKDTGVFSYEATGSIDQGAKTMTFDEGLSVANSLTEKRRKIIFQFTMNYTSNVKEALLKKTPFQLKENGKPSTSDQLLNVA